LVLCCTRHHLPVLVDAIKQRRKINSPGTGLNFPGFVKGRD
jgi:hypothetical protein